jgi:uncharacterized protein YqhQ
MEQEIQKKIDEQDAKLNAIYESVEKIRKYFVVTMWVTVLVVVLPAIGLMFVIPVFINSYMSSLEGLI